MNTLTLPSPTVKASHDADGTLVVIFSPSPEAPIVRTTAIRPADVREMREWLKVHHPEPSARPDDEHRPTAGPDFEPTPDDQAEASALLNAGRSDFWPSTWPDLLEVSTVSDWEYRAELAYEAERVAFGPLF